MGTCRSCKLGVHRWVERVCRPEWQALELHHYCRALDFLAQYKDEIELRVFDRVRDLFQLELDLVFWDTTSTYLEGEGPAGLAAFGYSKDTADVQTFRAALQDLKARRPIAERKIAELVRHGMRQARYIGKDKVLLVGRS